MDDTNRKAGTAPSFPTAALSALHQGSKIEAIKIVRQERNIGLKEAKDAVDDYVRSHPALQSSLAAAQAEAKRSALLWIAAVIVLAFLVYYFVAKP
jgi:ribosomal protein L7/L12